MVTWKDFHDLFSNFTKERILMMTKLKDKNFKFHAQCTYNSLPEININYVPLKLPPIQYMLTMHMYVYLWTCRTS